MTENQLSSDDTFPAYWTGTSTDESEYEDELTSGEPFYGGYGDDRTNDDLDDADLLDGAEDPYRRE